MTRKRLSDVLRDELENNPTDTSSTPDSELGADDQPPAASRSRRSNTLTKADLESMIEELKTNLTASQSSEAQLTQKVTLLQKELDAQKDLMQKLKADLKEAEQYQSKFAHAEETIRQLTAASALSNQATPKTTPEIDYRSQRLLLKKLPEHAIDHSVQPRAMAQKLTNADIGWVD
ncbi:hypothetical protein GS597_02345 [Synechococcales cyanobacterium C]|uniref:Uncharacterized protein n=1 Tax=Petrachloros mirabilis ULC683 TaxID=2781853 RepID=A0A8K1ZWF5_9CYAN|nr:hypothetical protein [Petrachloros mirabilis]NCJ05371.1 hypothetical protein [Petrachloros mirabilis ULC683]